MKRILALGAGVVLALSVAGVSALAATGGGGGCDTKQCRTTGLGVDAFWSSFSGDAPSPGVVYTDTLLFASTQTTSGAGASSSFTFACVDGFTWQVDDAGNFIPVADVGGCSNPGDASLAVPNSLASASLAATVQLTSCTFDANWNATCSEPSAASLTGRWSAVGPKFTSTSSYHNRFAATSFTSTFQGATRNATASALLASVAPPGALLSAGINNAHSNSVAICHRPGC